MAGVAAGGVADMCSSGVGKKLPARDISESVQLDFARSGTCLIKSRVEEEGWAGGKGGQGGQGAWWRDDNNIVLCCSSVRIEWYIYVVCSSRTKWMDARHCRQQRAPQSR